MGWGWMLLTEAGLAVVLGYLLTAVVIYRDLFFIYNPKTPVFFTIRLTSWLDPWKFGPEEDRKFALITWLTFTGIAAAMLFLADIVIWASPFLRRFYLWSMRTFGLKVTELLLACVVLFMGWAAFKAKDRHQRAYGVVEVIFAWIAAVITARQMKPGMDWSGQVATLIGAVYIVSRGLSNIRAGAEAIAEARSKAKAG